MTTSTAKHMGSTRRLRMLRTAHFLTANFMKGEEGGLSTWARVRHSRITQATMQRPPHAPQSPSSRRHNVPESGGVRCWRHKASSCRRGRIPPARPCPPCRSTGNSNKFCVIGNRPPGAFTFCSRGDRQNEHAHGRTSPSSSSSTTKQNDFASRLTLVTRTRIAAKPRRTFKGHVGLLPYPRLERRQCRLQVDRWVGWGGARWPLSDHCDIVQLHSPLSKTSAARVICKCWALCHHRNQPQRLVRTPFFVLATTVPLSSLLAIVQGIRDTAS